MSANGTGIGASVKRKEDARFLTGRGRYTDDINLPGQLYGYILRSPVAHAAIGGVDTSAAMAAPGVHAVFTGKGHGGRGRHPDRVADPQQGRLAHGRAPASGAGHGQGAARGRLRGHRGRGDGRAVQKPPPT